MEERAKINVSDPKVTEEDMFLEFHYTLGLNEKTMPELKSLIKINNDPKEAAKQAICIFLQKKVVAYDGSDVPINSQTLCIHSDTPNALEIAKKIKYELLVY